MNWIACLKWWPSCATANFWILICFVIHSIRALIRIWHKFVVGFFLYVCFELVRTTKSNVNVLNLGIYAIPSWWLGCEKKYSSFRMWTNTFRLENKPNKNTFFFSLKKRNSRSVAAGIGVESLNCRPLIGEHATINHLMEIIHDIESKTKKNVWANTKRNCSTAIRHKLVTDIIPYLVLHARILCVYIECDRRRRYRRRRQRYLSSVLFEIEHFFLYFILSADCDCCKTIRVSWLYLTVIRWLVLLSSASTTEMKYLLTCAMHW